MKGECESTMVRPVAHVLEDTDPTPPPPHPHLPTSSSRLPYLIIHAEVVRSILMPSLHSVQVRTGGRSWGQTGCRHLRCSRGPC